MQGWIDGIQNALEYIEEHLLEELDVRDVAAQAYVSAFHFQRVFSVLCGFTVGEYIRNRRLSLAAQELSATDGRVIDVALAYGYESPDSFTRAFTRFHGISPSAAKEKGAKLRSFAPLHIQISLEGARMLEYKIVEKPSFTVMGLSRTFSNETSYSEIPKFWQEKMERYPDFAAMYGVCMDSNGKDFTYLIAGNYIPWEDVPEGFTTETIPAGTWAVFPCRGALPEALQAVNTRMWKEWVPSCREYKLGGNYNIEMYGPPDGDYNEIWLPVKPV
ncbi:MAG: AraC family transcriptional regulator [Eubacteriales bacterium]|nr:AraC family transcriptional regulator [Eubacteriales bacterium]